MLTRRSFLEKAAAAGALAFAPGCGSTAQPDPSPGTPPPPAAASRDDQQQQPVDRPAVDPPAGDPPPTEACLESEDNPLGPYYSANAPVKSTLRESGMAGTPLVIEGYVLGLGAGAGTTTCAAIAGAEVDVWQADDAGTYDNVGFTLRGVFVSDANGKYRMETILPGRYLDGAEYRPRHIHVRVRAAGRTELITQLYFEGDPYNATDGMFKQALTMTPKDDGKGGLSAAFHFVLS